MFACFLSRAKHTRINKAQAENGSEDGWRFTVLIESEQDILREVEFPMPFDLFSHGESELALQIDDLELDHAESRAHLVFSEEV